MTECLSCAKNLESDWNFCPGCGKPLQAAKPLAPAIEGLADVRAQVFEVIVRQALIGAPWRAICAGPMVVNQITESEVEEEVRRRRGDEPTAPVKVPPAPPPQGDGTSQVSLPLPNPDWNRLESLLKDLAGKDDMELVGLIKAELAEQLAPLLKEIEARLTELRQSEAKAALEGDMSRELNRTRVDLSPKQPPGPHHINWGNNS